MFQIYPDGSVRRSWKVACNTCQSPFEPVKPSVMFPERCRRLQADYENQPDVVLVRSPRADSGHGIRNGVRQRCVSTCSRYYARDFQGKKDVLFFPFVTKVRHSGQCTQYSTEFGFTQRIQMRSVRNHVRRCRKGDIRHRAGRVTVTKYSRTTWRLMRMGSEFAPARARVARAASWDGEVLKRARTSAFVSTNIPISGRRP